MPQRRRPNDATVVFIGNFFRPNLGTGPNSSTLPDQSSSEPASVEPEPRPANR